MTTENMLAGLAGMILGGFIVALMNMLRPKKEQLTPDITRAEYDTLAHENTALATRLQSTLDSMDALNDNYAELRHKHEALHTQAITLQAAKSAVEERLNEQQNLWQTQFKQMAGTILEEVSTKFSTQSQKQLGEVLHPFRERLGEFQKLVTDSFSTQGKEQHSLKNEIEKIVLQTGSLTKALRGDVKAQGNWGEIMLERILEESGLEKGVAYAVQGVDMNLATADGSRQRPDVIIHLPEGKHIIIDSKVSLTAYERFCAEPQEDMHLRDFIKSIKAHIIGLEQKRYQDNEKLSTPDFVLMFMPIEGAYSLALQQDRELHQFAWGRRIVMVCPTTLFTTLQTIASLWRIESQNRNTQEIARQAGALYDKFVGFVDDLEMVGKRLDDAQGAYDKALNKLKDGKGNLITSTEKLRKLGVKNTKLLRSELVTDESDEVAKPLLALVGEE